MNGSNCWARTGSRAPILNPEEAFHHPQVQALALGIFQSPRGLEMPLVSAPWSINGIRPPVRRRAPLLGEDNDAVLRKHPGRCSGLTREATGHGVATLNDEACLTSFGWRGYLRQLSASMSRQETFL
jgi:hypothetical protein